MSSNLARYLLAGLLCVIMSLAACGKKGPLYLPEKQARAMASSHEIM